MPRIRTIKPEFWSHPLVRKTGLRYVSTTPILPTPRQSWAGLPGHLYGDGFLYFFFGKGGCLLYVGMTTAPRLRVSQHRRKDWWPQAVEVEIAAFDCPDRKLAEKALRCLEAVAISMMGPRENIAMPSKDLLEVANSALV